MNIINWKSQMDSALRDIYVNSYNKKSGTRSRKRIQILHSLIVSYIKNKLNNNQDYKFYYDDEWDKKIKEKKIDGVFYSKKIDIAIYKIIDNKFEFFGGIATKFIFSNLLQNHINYFEQMIAETLNFKLNQKKYYQLILIKNNLPYFTSGKKAITKIEILNDNFYYKYYKYMNNYHTKEMQPDGIYIGKIDYYDYEIIKERIVKKEKFDFEEFSKELINNLDKINLPLSIEEFSKYDKIDDINIKNFFTDLNSSFFDFLNKIIIDLEKFK